MRSATDRPLPGASGARPRGLLPEPRPGFVAVGWIRGPRGVQGELKVDVLTEFPERFARGARLWIAGQAYTVRRSRVHQGTLLLRLEGVETREEAERLRHQLLELPESELKPLGPDQYYRFQLIGLEAVDTSGAPLGRVEDVLETGANDVYVVRDERGELLIPAIDSVVKAVDLAAGRMTVDLPPGLERKPLQPTRPRRRRARRRSI